MTIKIGKWMIPIVFRSGIEDKETTYYGQADYQNSRILINSNVQEVMQKQTLLHEIMHFCLHYNGLSEDDSGKEDILECLGNWMWDVMEDNPE